MSQPMVALAEANRRRFGHAGVKAEVKAGTLTVADALDDPRAQTMPLMQLLCAQVRWGVHRSGRLMRACGIAPLGRGRHDRRVDRLVGDLTERQRAEIRARMSERGAA